MLPLFLMLSKYGREDEGILIFPPPEKPEQVCGASC